MNFGFIFIVKSCSEFSNAFTLTHWYWLRCHLKRFWHKLEAIPVLWMTFSLQKPNRFLDLPPVLKFETWAGWEPCALSSTVWLVDCSDGFPRFQVTTGSTFIRHCRCTVVKHKIQKVWMLNFWSFYWKVLAQIIINSRTLRYITVVKPFHLSHM